MRVVRSCLYTLLFAAWALGLAVSVPRDLFGFGLSFVGTVLGALAFFIVWDWEWKKRA